MKHLVNVIIISLMVVLMLLCGVRVTVAYCMHSGDVSLYMGENVQSCDSSSSSASFRERECKVFKSFSLDVESVLMSHAVHVEEQAVHFLFSAPDISYLSLLPENKCNIAAFYGRPPSQRSCRRVLSSICVFRI